MPDLYGGLRDIDAASGAASYDAAVARVYEETKPESIDYGVMEKSRDVLLVRGDFGWSDVGSWDALYDLLAKDERGNAVIGRCLSVDSSKTLVYSPEKLVALLGVEDLIVVETGDALLICGRGRSQEVRSVVETLEKQHMKDYL
jgi:mannose-1-phosphate guanylyltransferase